MEKMPEITYYSNASGETFLPKNGNESCCSTKLPYPLQQIYYRYWYENGSGMLNYLVSIDKNYGLLLVAEYDIKHLDDKTSEQLSHNMDVLFEKTVIPTASKIKKLLSLFCPDAMVYVGNQTGFNECHEIAVFFPYDTPKDDMVHGLFVLNEISSGNTVSTSTDIFNTHRYERFFNASYQFNGNMKISKYYSQNNFKHFTIQFRESNNGENNATVNIDIVLEDDETPELLTSLIQDAVEEVKQSATNFGLGDISVEDIIFLSCSAIVPSRWEYQKPPTEFVYL